MCHNTVLWLGRLSFWAHDNLVLASDVMATDCWLNVWCIWQIKLETLQEFRSHHWIGWMCVMSFNDLPGSQTKVFTTVTMSTYQDQLNAGFSKVFEICKLCGIDSLIYNQEFYTLLSVIVGTFPHGTKLNAIGCFTCQYIWPIWYLDLLPSVWLCETNIN